MSVGWRSEEHTSELQSHSDLHSFPTRRSSDLTEGLAKALADPARRDRMRRNIAVGHLIEARRAGEFRLCPFCHRLVYVSARKVEAEAPGFHGGCYVSWLEIGRAHV